MESTLYLLEEVANCPVHLNIVTAHKLCLAKRLYRYKSENTLGIFICTDTLALKINSCVLIAAVHGKGGV